MFGPGIGSSASHTFRCTTSRIHTRNCFLTLLLVIGFPLFSKYVLLLGNSLCLWLTPQWKARVQIRHPLLLLKGDSTTPARRRNPVLHCPIAVLTPGVCLLVLSTPTLPDEINPNGKTAPKNPQERAVCVSLELLVTIEIPALASGARL